MRPCNAQTKDRQLVPVAPLQPPRGLELIKSSAKFYANGAGVTQPTIQLSFPVRGASNNPASMRAFSSSIGKLRVHVVTMMCLFLLVLPGLALAVIVWWGTRMADAGAPKVVIGEANSLSARLPSSLVTRRNDRAQTVSNAQSDIIIRKVKTERIDAGAWAERDLR